MCHMFLVHLFFPLRETAERDSSGRDSQISHEIKKIKSGETSTLKPLDIKPLSYFWVWTGWVIFPTLTGSLIYWTSVGDSCWVIMLPCVNMWWSVTTVRHVSSSRTTSTMWQNPMLTRRVMWAYDRCRESLTTGGWLRDLGNRRTSRHCFIFCSVRAGGGCGNSLPDIHPRSQTSQKKWESINIFEQSIMATALKVNGNTSHRQMITLLTPSVNLESIIGLKMHVFELLVQASVAGEKPMHTQGEHANSTEIQAVTL